MNYIQPEDFDFYNELKEENKKIDIKESQIKVRTCLITGDPLDKNSCITLECGHTFNYIPLLNSVQEEKINMNSKSYYYYNSVYLREHQLRCPYCRQIQENILPYFPELHKRRIRGVNHPSSLSMGKNECNHIFKSGKNKGSMCGKKCYRSKCSTHYRPEVSLSDIVLSMESLSKETIPKLRMLAKYYKLKNYSTLKKKDLINLLLNNSSN